MGLAGVCSRVGFGLTLASLAVCPTRLKVPHWHCCNALRQRQVALYQAQHGARSDRLAQLVEQVELAPCVLPRRGSFLDPYRIQGVARLDEQAHLLLVGVTVKVDAGLHCLQLGAQPTTSRLQNPCQLVKDDRVFKGLKASWGGWGSASSRWLTLYTTGWGRLSAACGRLTLLRTACGRLAALCGGRGGALCRRQAVDRQTVADFEPIGK